MKRLPWILLIASIIGVGAKLAAASSIPQTPAVFETYLATQQSSSDTTATLASGTLRDGTTLAGYVCFTIDSNLSTLEYECGTANGTAITGITRGIGPLTGTSTVASLTFVHRRGSDVKITDFPTLSIIQRLLSGIDTFITIPTFDSSIATTTFSNRQQFIDKGYVDDTAFNGAGVINATTNASGVVQLGTSANMASSTNKGSSGASLVVTTSNATDTPQSSCNALFSSAGAGCVVVANLGGRIAANFIASSTYATASSTLVLGSNGTMSWSSPSSLGGTFTSTSQSNNAATTTIYYATIAGNTFGTSKSICLNFPMQYFQFQGQATYLAVGYGGATTTVKIFNNSSVQGTYYHFINACAGATGATNSQAMTLNLDAASTTESVTQQITTGAADSTKSQGFDVEIRNPSGSNDGYTTYFGQAILGTN